MTRRREWLTQAMSSTISPASTSADARRVSLLVGVLFGLTGLGSSSAAIALPVMASDFGVSTGVSAWAISLYALMLAVATAVYGRISDLVGVRIPLAVGVGLMTAGALAGALAPSFGSLLVARIVQGAGAAAVPTLEWPSSARATPDPSGEWPSAGSPASPPQ